MRLDLISFLFIAFPFFVFYACLLLSFSLLSEESEILESEELKSSFDGG